MLEKGHARRALESATQSLSRYPHNQPLAAVKLRALIALGQLPAAVSEYAAVTQRKPGPDPRLLAVSMAQQTLQTSLRLPSAAIQAQAIRVVESQGIESLADAVMELVASDNDLVAATAAAAVLTAHPEAPKVAHSLLRSSDAEPRATVVRGIGAAVGPLARDDLVAALRDSHVAVRANALAAIASWNDPQDHKALLTMLGDPDPAIVAQALRALRPRTPSDQARALAQPYLDHKYRAVRVAAVELLAVFDDPEITADLQELALRSDSATALAAAIAVFRRTGAGVPNVFARWAGSPQPAQRTAALLAASRGLEKFHALTLAGALVIDPQASVRLAAARLLARHGVQRRAMAEFEHALASDEPATKLAAAGFLATRGHGQAIVVLSRLACHRDPDLQRKAIAAHKSARQFTPGLVAALATNNTEIRLLAADAILTVAR